MHINAGHEHNGIFNKKSWHENACKTTYHQLENTVIHQQGWALADPFWHIKHPLRTRGILKLNTDQNKMSKITDWVYSASLGVWFRSYWLRKASSNVQHLTGSIPQPHRDLLGAFISSNPPETKLFKCWSASFIPQVAPVRVWDQRSAGTRVLLRGVSAPRDASLTNLQRCLQASTHGSTDSTPGNLPPTIGHFHKVVSFKRKPASKRHMWFEWDNALQMS